MCTSVIIQCTGGIQWAEGLLDFFVFKFLVMLNERVARIRSSRQPRSFCLRSETCGYVWICRSVKVGYPWVTFLAPCAPLLHRYSFICLWDCWTTSTETVCARVSLAKNIQQLLQSTNICIFWDETEKNKWPACLYLKDNSVICLHVYTINKINCQYDNFS